MISFKEDDDPYPKTTNDIFSAIKENTAVLNRILEVVSKPPLIVMRPPRKTA